MWASSASAAVTQKQAAARAIDALGADQGDSALIVFGLPKPVKAGTSITQAGTQKPTKGSTRGLSSKLRSAGVRLVKAPRVMTARTRSYLFYEDRGPYQLYQHPGRVALVDVASGKVTLSKTITWPPLVNGKLPAFLKSSGAYRSSKYQVLYRAYEVNGATQQQRPLNRNLFDQDPFGPGRPLPSKANSKVIADRLAAERSCALRVTDTLPSFWNANELNMTRSYVGTLFEQLERENGRFVDDRYGARSGETLAQSVDRLGEAGCKDILLYLAGQGYSTGGEPVIHLGTAVRRGGMIAQQNVSATDLRNLVSARPGITFKFKIDAPYAGGMIDILRDLQNVLLIETPSATGDEAFAFIPQVENQNGQMISSTPNPAGLLEFTNCELVGLKAFFDSATEIDKATQGQNEGVSFLAEMLARGQELCNGEGGYADDLGAAPQLYAKQRASGNGTNRPPKADKQDVTVTEDTPKSITLTASDPDNDTLTYSITKNPDHGTLSGSGPNVTYTPDADYVGTDDFSFKVDDGKGASNTAKVDINVVPGNDPAVVTTSAGNTSYTEDDPGVIIDGSLTVADPDDTQLEGAEVRIHGDDRQANDALQFTNTPAINGFYDAANGALFLTGTASVADYQAALRSVRFHTSSDKPRTPKRIEFRADDGDGLGPAATKNVVITNVNDAPEVDASDSTLAYTENDGPVAIDEFVSLSDPDSDNLSGATIDAGPSWVASEDQLAFVDNDTGDGITLGSYNDATGVLTLTGTGDINEYAAAVRAVTYENSSENPDETDRTFDFTVTDDASAASNTDTRTISVTRVNDAPTVNTSAGDTSYTEGNSGTAVDPALTAGDVDDTNLESARVRISSGFEDGDKLVFVNTPNITGTYDSGTGVLTLNGTDTVANYQAALRSITFNNTTDDDMNPTKVVEFKVNDGSLDSNLASKNIAVTPVNDNSTLDTTDAALSYTEGDGAVDVDNGITVTDPDSTNLVGATVQITSNFSGAEDDLVFSNQNGITGSYNDATGTLTLSGSATLAQYQTALRSVDYQNTSDNPDTNTRTISFQVDDGGSVDNMSNVATRDITITRVNDAPTVNTSNGDTSYTEGNAPTAVDPNLTVGDVDDTNLESAQVRISSGFESGDTLHFVDTATIDGDYSNGVLTLTGTASVADYQAALRSIGFSNTTDDDMNPTKVVEFKVHDGALDSNLATKNIAVTPVNDHSTIDTSDTALSYTEGDGAVAVDTGISITDPDSANLAGATVDGDAGNSWVPAEDQLSWVDNDAGDGITLGSYDDTTGVLTLTGTGTLAQYVAALEAVRYENSSDNPDTTTRTVGFQVDDGGAVDNLSNVATRDITISRVNDAPVVNTSNGSTSYTEGGSPTAVDGSLTVTDADDTNLESAEVRISNNFESGDTLHFTDTATIDGDYSNGVLTLTGTASVADYQVALRSITYSNTTDDDMTSPKTVSFKVNDGDTNSNTATKDIAVTPVNDAPTVNTSAGDTSYTEGDAATTIDGALTASDPDDTNLESAQVRISSGFQTGDSLVFADQNGITGAYNAGVLTLTGTASEADYQTALRSVKYQTTNDDPSSPKTIEFKVNDGDADSNLATKNIVVTPANDAPVVTTSAGNASYTEGDPATTVDGALTVSDVDDTNIESARVEITTGLQSGDTLHFTDTATIDGDYSNGVLTLTGTDTVANYQAALRSVGFSTTNDNPSGKTVEFKVNDGNLDSAGALKTINVTGQNDGPVITTTASTHNYTEGQGAQPVDPGLMLSDPENDQISTATVKIANNFIEAEDDLVFADQNGITGSYDDSSGTLTLTGTASVADYQTALRSVAYQNTSDDPDNSTRTVSFRATDAGTPNQASNVATRDVAVADANDAPVVNTSNGSTSYTEGDPATTIDGALTVSDVDDTNLESAQVRISSGFQTGDKLVFADQNGIAGNYTPGTGVLTLTGSASEADYQTALRSIKFESTNDAPVGSKTIEFKVNDGDADSNLATKELTVTPANDAPTLNTSAGNATFTEDLTGPVAVDPNLTLSDPDSTNVQGATVEITTGFNSSEDQLILDPDPQNGISGSYNSGTGVLTLSGTASVADYQAALRSVKYNNTDTVAPDTTQRTVRFQATDDGGAPSNFATRNVTINSVNDAPVVSTSNGSTPYTEDDPATTVDGTLTVSDQDDTNLEGGQVRISSGFQSGDSLVFGNQNGITGNYDSGTGVLTLTGTASVADYQTALRSVQFQSTEQQPVTSKTVEFKVNDGDTDSNLATKELAVTPTNDAPIVNATNAALSYTENDPATAVDTGLTIDDTEDDNLSGGSASITANYQAGQDFLAWTDNNLGDSITLDMVNSNQQTIVLTGVDTEANYQAALRAVTYQNGSEAPTNVARTVTFSATDQPGLTGSDTRTINVIPVDDPPDAVNDSATVLEDAAATSVPVLTNDTDIDGGPKTISSATDPANGTVVLTGGSAGAHTGLTYQPDPNYCNDPPGTTPDTFQYTVNGGDTAFVSMTVTCVNDAPVADDETFNGASSAVGNTTHIVNDPSDGAPTAADPTDTGAGSDRPHKAITGDILDGDTDIDGPGPYTVTPGTFATNDGGSVTIESDGDFTFEPAAGTSCTDTSDFFDYTVEDSHPTDEKTDTGRVTIAIANCVWYVNNHDVQGNSGTSAAPFDTTQQAETASGSGHFIYVYEGNGTTLGHTSGLNMKANQSLVGEAADLVVGGHTLQQEDNSKRPQLTDALEDVVALDDGNTVTGIDADPTGAFSGIAGGSGDTGGGTIADVRIIDTGVAATNAGLELISTTGTFNVSDLTVNNTAALGQTGGSKGVELSSAGTVNFNPTGTISLTTTGGAGLDATSTNLGTSTFDTITTSGSSTGGVVLTNTTNPVGGSTTFGDLSLTTTSGSTGAFRVSSGGTIVVPSGGSANVHATGGPGVDVSSTTGAQLNFDDVDSTNSSTDGINLDGLGSGVFNASSGDIGGAAGVSFDLNDGDGAITFPGNLNNGSGAAIEITSRDGGAVTLSGPISDTNDASGGILLSANTGGTTTISNATKQVNTTGGNVPPANGGVVMNASDGHTLFLTGGGLDIDTTNGKGLEADTSGTIEVSGSGNTVDTTTGRAVNISDTDIHANDVTFQRVRSDGAATGIRLNNTGASGNMVVTGNGGTCTNANTSGCSGGEIENGTGAGSESNTPDGTGIVLNNTVAPSFTRMWIHDHTNYGIRGANVNGFTLANSVINGTIGNDTDSGAFTPNESAVYFNHIDTTGASLTGSASVTNTHIQGGHEDNFYVSNDSGVLNRLTMDGVTIGANSTTQGNQGITLEGLGTSTLNATLQNSALTASRSTHFQFKADGSGGGDLDYFDNDVSNNHPAVGTGGGAVLFQGGAGGGTVDINVNSDGDGTNTFRDAKGPAVIFEKTIGAAATFNGTINNADVGLAAVANSGSSEGSGLRAEHEGGGTMNMTVTNNEVRQYNNFGMDFQAGDGIAQTGTINLNVQSNIVGNPGTLNPGVFQGIRINNGVTPGDSFQTCYRLVSNTATGAGRNGGHDLRALSRGTGTVRLPGFAGGSTDDTGVANYMLANNTASTASAVRGDSGTWSGTGASCP